MSTIYILSNVLYSISTYIYPILSMPIYLDPQQGLDSPMPCCFIQILDGPIWTRGVGGRYMLEANVKLLIMDEFDAVRQFTRFYDISDNLYKILDSIPYITISELGDEQLTPINLSVTDVSHTVSNNLLTMSFTLRGSVINKQVGLDKLKRVDIDSNIL